MGLDREGSSTRNGSSVTSGGEKRPSIGGPFHPVKNRKEQEAERKFAREEWKKMVWWEVMFYDL